jgi:23S rRNA (adenine2503-C2)-methyltransferase
VTPSRPDLGNLDRPALEAVLAERGIPRFRARQIFGWIYRRGATDVAAMTNLSLELRETLARDFELTTPEVVTRERSVDGTEKFLLRLTDRRQIESVFIPDTPAMTFCISTQVGCAMACAFCLTGKMGLMRNLTAAEIVGQVRILADALAMRGTRFNIVLMGMGEPLHNYDNTLKALRILNMPEGLRIGARHMTVSTVGLVPGILRLAEEPLQVNLAISLHAPNNAMRLRTMPVTRKYPIEQVLEAVRAYAERTGRQVTFEYVLLAGVNDADEHARELAQLLAPLKQLGHVNLIPVNQTAAGYQPPGGERIRAFRELLRAGGVTSSVRAERGDDIAAACGQLRTRETRL